MERIFERLENRANRAYWGDGMLDLFCSVAVLAIGVAWVTDHVVFGAIAPGLLVPFWKPMRRRFTEPRLGSVELVETRQRRNRAFINLLLVAGVLSFLAGIGLWLAVRHGEQPAVIAIKAMPGTLVGIIGVATAEALGLRRFHLYGLATIAAAIIVAMTPRLNPGWAFMAGGTIALIGGIVIAHRFVRRYPPQTKDGPS